jgi:hypothetical protein
VTDQGALFDVPTPDLLKPWQRRNPHELARRTDPATSHAAARALGGKAGTMRRQLLVTFSLGEATGEEAAIASGLDRWQASKRTSDLLAAGLIVDTGRTRTGTAGRQQRVLQITAEGLEALR